MTGQVQTLQTENAGLRARAAQAQQQIKEVEERYKAQLPAGDSKALLDLANRKLGEGVDMARLTFLINAASNPRVCDEKPETKRLQVKTPIGKTGKEASAAFADRKVTVTAEGQPALDGKGQKESWFDPAQPITVHFAPLAGQIHRCQRRGAAAASDGDRRFRVPLLDRCRRAQGLRDGDGRAVQFSVRSCHFRPRPLPLLPCFERIQSGRFQLCVGSCAQPAIPMASAP